MNYSKQRELIEAEVKRERVHPTADTVYSRLKPAHPALSLGTVYRNLNLLADLGRIRRIPVPNSRDRYDGDVSAHDHVICRRCGKVCDVSVPRLEDLDEEVERLSGFRVAGHDLIVYGLCPDCARNEEM